MPQRILIVDDEPNILATVAPLLRSRGYTVLSATTGRAALESVDGNTPDLIVLDLGLADLDGIDVCRQIRQTSSAPIIVLSARGAEGDKVAALDAGADDYVTKPFGAEELPARIRAALRRSDSTFGTAGTITRGELVIDRERFRVVRDGRDVRLTPKEYDLLAHMARHAGLVMTHRQLLNAVWGPAHVEDVQYLRVFVGQLRGKVERDASAPILIRTEPGVGYRLVVRDQA